MNARIPVFAGWRLKQIRHGDNFYSSDILRRPNNLKKKSPKIFEITVELGNRELFGRPKTVP